MTKDNTISCCTSPIKPGRKYDSFSPELWLRLGLVENEVVRSIEAVGTDERPRSGDIVPAKTNVVHRLGDSVKELFVGLKCRTVKFRKYTGAPNKIGLTITGPLGQFSFIMTMKNGIGELWQVSKAETTDGMHVMSRNSGLYVKQSDFASKAEQVGNCVKDGVLYAFDAPAVMKSIRRASKTCGRAAVINRKRDSLELFDHLSDVFAGVGANRSGTFVQFRRCEMKRNEFDMRVFCNGSVDDYVVGTEFDSSTFWGTHVGWCVSASSGWCPFVRKNIEKSSK